MPHEKYTPYIVNITNENKKQRIDNFLRIYLKNIPKSMIYRMLRKGIIRINKKHIKPQYKLETGDQVFIPLINDISKSEKKTILPNMKKVSALSDMILYEDDHVLALNKPSGIAVHGGSGLSFGVIEGLRALRPKICFLELMHRLDRQTSGVLILAKKRSVLRSLHEQLRNNKIQKDYLALVRGQWQSNLRIVRVPLLKTIQRNNGKRITLVDKKGKSSETRFKIEELYTFATLLRCSPITGRTHQIRVHTQYVGHPIAFDDLYGDKEFNRDLAIIGLSRLFLHAVSLKFTHPNNNTIIQIEAPLDEHLKKCLDMLRSYKILRI